MQFEGACACGALRYVAGKPPVAAGLISVLIALGACAQSDTEPELSDEPSVFAAVQTTTGRLSQHWKFEITAADDTALGDIELLLTNEVFEQLECDGQAWRRAEVIDNGLEYDIGDDISPAFILRGPWLTIDLAATTCNMGYRLVGTLTGQAATGHFSFVHSLGGEYVGTFTGVPIVSDGDDDQALPVEN